jgi:hypothetical protein
MVKHLATQAESLYGFPQPLMPFVEPPVAAKRAPATTDTGYKPGQFWVDETGGAAYILVSNTGGVATWLSIGGSLTPAVASLVTGAAATATTLAGNVWSATGTNAAITLYLTPKGAGGVDITTGDLAALTGSLIAAVNVVATTGNVEIETAGRGLQIAEGANARMGVSAALGAGGTLAVANTSVTANTRVFLTYNAPGGVLGSLSYVVNPGVGFTINSSSAADTSTVTWLLIEAI